jgi:hypothetical protein
MPAAALRLPARARPWWLWLHAWQWLNLWRARPLRSAAVAASWLLPCLLVPAALRLSGRSTAAAALQWVSSFDIPIALVLAAVTGSRIIAAVNERDTEDWLQPRIQRGTARIALLLLRLAGMLRWPAGLLIAAWLLAIGQAELRQTFVQLLLIIMSGVAGGIAFGWVLIGQRDVRSRNPRPPPATGLTALSLAPLFATHRSLGLRRLAALLIPAMLAAPMGATLDLVARMLATWLPLLYLGTCLREAGHISMAMRQWLPQARLGWWVWRHVLLALAATGALLWGASLLMRPERMGAHP